MEFGTTQLPTYIGPNRERVSVMYSGLSSEPRYFNMDTGQEYDSPGAWQSHGSKELYDFLKSYGQVPILEPLPQNTGFGGMQEVQYIDNSDPGAIAKFAKVAAPLAIAAMGAGAIGGGLGLTGSAPAAGTGAAASEAGGTFFGITPGAGVTGITPGAGGLGLGTAESIVAGGGGGLLGDAALSTLFPSLGLVGGAAGGIPAVTDTGTMFGLDPNATGIGLEMPTTTSLEGMGGGTGLLPPGGEAFTFAPEVSTVGASTVPLNSSAVSRVAGDWWTTPGYFGDQFQASLKNLLPDGGDMNLMDLLAGGASIYGAVSGKDAAEDAATAQLWRSLQADTRAQKLLAPYIDFGTDALDRIRELQEPGSQVSAMELDPGYDFRLNEGLKAIQRDKASRGMLKSGATLKALTQYGQGVASQEYNNIINRLLREAGYGSVATGTGVSSGSELLTGAGNAEAAGIVGGQNALTDAINQLLRYITRR